MKRVCAVKLRSSLFQVVDAVKRARGKPVTSLSCWQNNCASFGPQFVVDGIRGDAPAFYNSGGTSAAEAVISISYSDAFHGCERTLAVNEERVQVRIPPGVKTGSRLRLKAKGNLQPGTGRRGDLYLTLKLQEHPIWKLDGDQLRGELPLSLDELALGGEVRVATPDGEATLQVPAGISLGRSLRLKGKGWPIKGGRGDLLLTPVLRVPQQLTEQEQALFEQLRELRSSNPRSGWLQAGRL